MRVGEDGLLFAIDIVCIKVTCIEPRKTVKGHDMTAVTM
jgi:hypothetical protein